MPVEQREQVTRVETVRVNGQPEELAGFGGRRQPSLGGTSRMNREIHVRICERLGVRFPGPTRRPVRMEGLSRAEVPDENLANREWPGSLRDCVFGGSGAAGRGGRDIPET